jgi:hypothetical protein
MQLQQMISVELVRSEMCSWVVGEVIQAVFEQGQTTAQKDSLVAATI